MLHFNQSGHTISLGMLMDYGHVQTQIVLRLKKNISGNTETLESYSEARGIQHVNVVEKYLKP